MADCSRCGSASHRTDFCPAPASFCCPLCEGFRAALEKAERERDEISERFHSDGVISSECWEALSGDVRDVNSESLSVVVRRVVEERDAARRENAELQKRLARVEEILAERVNENAALKLECERLRLAECDAQADLDRALDGTAELREAIRSVQRWDQLDDLLARLDAGKGGG